jgi:hypothetical protein
VGLARPTAGVGLARPTAGVGLRPTASVGPWLFVWFVAVGLGFVGVGLGFADVGL